MKLHGCVALVALAASGCVGTLGQTVPPVSASLEGRPIELKTTCSSEIKPRSTCGQPAVEVAAKGSELGRSPISVSTMNVEPLPRADATPTITNPEKVEPIVPATPQDSDRAEPPNSVNPSIAIVEPPNPPKPVPPVVEVDTVDPPISAPLVPPVRPEPEKPKGRPVASVGTEIISLPELTEATKARIAQLSSCATPNRRQVIALAKDTLKSMIVRSLITQEAVAKLGGPERLSELETRSGQTWADRELPALLRKEGVATEPELRKTLAKRMTTPEILRDEFILRSVVTEMMLLDHLDLDYDTYLDALRNRRPIRSIMTPAELMAAGRRAATDESAAR